MTSTRDSFLQFIGKLHQDTGESVTEAYQILSNTPEIAKMFAEQSPKFVEIFSILTAGAGKTETSVPLFQIIIVLFEELSKSSDLYFGQLHYLADSIIRRYINDLISYMGRKQAKLALSVLINAAKVHHTHCREIFRSLDFSNHIFKLQSKPESGARKEYVQLATLFLENPEISPSFMGSKFYLSSIWKNLSQDESETLRAFLTALMKNLEQTNLSTRCWVFSEKTLVNFAQFPLQKTADNSDPKSLVFDLLEKLVTGPTSILLEDPSRTYCISIPDIDPPPKNLNFLEFIRKLEPFKRDGHREVACMIFKQSPDLISHYFSRITRTISDELTLANLAAIHFVTSVVSLPWPDFLYKDEKFIEEGRSINLLFESILPEFIDTNKLNSIFVSNKNILVTKAYLVLLISSVRKFKQLPFFLKTSTSYNKLSSRLPPLDILFNSKSDLIKSLTIKLLFEIDNAIPFYLQDNQSRLPKLLKSIMSQSPLIQLQLIKVSSLLQKPVSNLTLLSEIVLNDSVLIDIRKEALNQMIKIVTNSGVLDNNESEAKIWVSFSLKNKIVKELQDKINLVASKPHQFADGGNASLLCNGAVGSQIENCLPIIQKVHNFDDIKSLVSERKTISVKPPNDNILTLLETFKWYSIPECFVNLTRFEPDNVLCSILSVFVILCPQLTVMSLFESPLREKVFCGNDDLDKLFGLAIEINGKIDDDLTIKFLEGTSSQENVKRIAPFVDKKFTGNLIGKLLKSKLPIRPIIASQNIQCDLSKFDGFWKWIFEDFQAVDIDLLNLSPKKYLHLIKDEDLMKDILRTVYLTNKTDILSKLKIRDTSDDKLLGLIAHFYEDISLPADSLPVIYVRGLQIPNLVETFEKSRYEWSTEFLIRKISEQLFKEEIKRMRHEKTSIVLKIFMEDYNKTIEKTFYHALLSFITKHPDSVTKIPTEVIDLYTSAAEKLLNPEILLSFNENELKGVCNILNGADVNVSLRVILYLSVFLSEDDTFYSLVEVQNISPDKFMFVTGETAKTVIQQIENGQTILTNNLSRNVSYLQPFHMSHQINLDTPRFRFLIYFANYILEEKIVNVEHFMECGAISICLRGLSSNEVYIRELSYETLSLLYHLNSEQNWSKQSTVRSFLESLINSLVEENQRFCHLATHFFAHFSSVLMKPGHNLYMRVVKYICDTPAFRYNQIPLFENVFSKPNVNYRNERNYVLKVLMSGIKEEQDFPMLLKNNALERLMDLYSSTLSDMNTRKQIIDILTKVVAIGRVDGLLGWIYSVVDESFSTPHLSNLIKLAFKTTKRNENDNKFLKMLSQNAVNNKLIFDSCDDEDKENIKSFLDQEI
ncbi:hypothetical protein TVAG_249930 [Trichomonas vaginalis G3]|uniref:Nucleolar pre-ribosomal-associated protein 1 C-terminal domain-containing protein n=1 Tax=Trichomonas vaginalis (strain ATCC PRA-98 / G3) TaxID=412133 RepID=A2DCJ6_TRIV3|nr:maturation of LSU-rRNA from tricistronic rRNA transcript (SSU-rRNA, 5.8S rRNA, LSU-rRNA) [Trichomonas vaginalis G3]EAY21933.1 hypothetical protein TVAG_249930 [Trichomonas vaginalis G3]KAI5487592.1 maturation of LSU-rRNA from tricistronic rRNA transcript (SSU-rRNA, 5.8S rRNA, LSU-rRNA) [Trichomonas vaginalis G3]|eukprot:XP_001582919.1 hypothetical protein [Trichomonas vaginalis G3]